jgi:hypothetical protein
MTITRSSIDVRCNGGVPAGMPFMYVDPAADMAAFDELPYPIRQVLNFHPVKLAAAPVLAVWTDPSALIDFDCIERMHIILAQLASETGFAR